MTGRRFYDCSLSEKMLFTSFLLLIGLGYLMALSYLYVLNVNNDNEPGLSVEDVATNYYGNRSGTQMEAAIRGPMGDYVQEEELYEIVAWLKDGAPQQSYEENIKPIMEANCTICHNATTGMNLASLTTYSDVRVFAEIDTGMSLGSLLKLSHIHLFGISLLLFALGFIFIHSQLNEWFKLFLVLSPMVAVFVDILAWFLTKWDPVYAYTVVIAGAFLGFSMGMQILISLYQIWFLKRPAREGGR